MQRERVSITTSGASRGLCVVPGSSHEQRGETEHIFGALPTRGPSRKSRCAEVRGEWGWSRIEALGALGVGETLGEVEALGPRSSGPRAIEARRAVGRPPGAPPFVIQNRGQEGARGERDRLGGSARAGRGSGRAEGAAVLRRRNPRRASSSCRRRSAPLFRS